MNLQQFTFQAFSTKIQGFHTKPENPKAVIVLVHGFGEHSGRYLENVVPMLLDSGLAVVMYDNIGHGKSSGNRGHCPSYKSLLDILDLTIQKAVELYPKLPIFLYGHSMGGNLILNYALRREPKIKGIVATSPYLRLAFQPPQWKMILGKALLNILPSITMPSGLDPNGISRIPEEVEKYKSDQLVHDKVSPMYSFPIIEAGEWAIAHAGALRVETLLLHGTGDPIIDYRGTEEFHKNATETTLKLFEDGYHELHNDLCKEEMLETVKKWLQERM
ncbi:alpha/beta hydrolase [Maribacter halichondriae]|uniref:alpha/beta hydrolase n=1 Tax=Maribacter halichondriae TaxID=2980554 RepID=UPI00235A2371|nr:alpha/beta hydrolase [Maribacter sp. Hal144]